MCNRLQSIWTFAENYKETTGSLCPQPHRNPVGTVWLFGPFAIPVFGAYCAVVCL